MQLEQEFTIPTDVDHAWRLIVDAERIAPCFPGAMVTGVEGDAVEGQVKLKLGPITLTYAGVLRFVELDEIGHRLVMDGRGVDAKGNGSASARVTAQLASKDDGSTHCALITDLNITGRPAQFGRGMMLDVGNNILGRFSTNLAAMLSAESTSEKDGAPLASSASALPDALPASTQPDEALDLLRAARGATLKRALPALAGLAVVIAVIWWLAS